MLDHLINGIVFTQDEMHRNDAANKAYTGDDPANQTYELQCGLPDITVGELISVERVWGIKSSSGYDFVRNTDYTYDTTTNELIFESAALDPDDETEFYVSYRYDQKFTSGLSAYQSGSVVNMIFAPVSISFGNIYAELGNIKDAALIDYALGDDLDEVVKLLNITRNQPVGATGHIIGYRTGTSGDQIVSLGSQVKTNATPTNPSTFFETTEAKTIFNGVSSVKIAVQAITGHEGSAGNIRPNTLNNIVTSGVLVASNNPATFSDYEFVDVVSGQNVYDFLFRPKRTLNNTVYPANDTSRLLPTDRGFISAVGWSDKTINDVNWSVGSGTITITEDDPETGLTKVAVTATGYITITGLSIPTDTDATDEGYDQLMIMIRSATNLTFRVQVDNGGGDTNVSLYRFNDGEDYGGGTYAVASMDTESEFKMYHGAHRIGGASSAAITTIKIHFEDTGDYFIDWIALGTFLQEVATAELDDPDEVTVSYTAKKLSVYDHATNTDFFDLYSNQILLYYEWENFYSGGADEETDDELRDRAKRSFQVQETATKSALEAGILDIDGISEVDVQDYNDDPSIEAGNCYIYVLAEGFYLSQALKDSVTAVVDEKIGAGIRGILFTPEIRYVNFSIHFYYDDTFDEYKGVEGQSALETEISSAIDDFFSGAKINQDTHMSNVVAFVIKEVIPVIGGSVKFTMDSEPTFSDDNYDSGYAFESGVDTGEISQDAFGDIIILAQKTGATLVVQRGNGVVITSEAK
jgi:hypothetical protein